MPKLPIDSKHFTTFVTGEENLYQYVECSCGYKTEPDIEIEAAIDEYVTHVVVALQSEAA